MADFVSYGMTQRTRMTNNRHSSTQTSSGFREATARRTNTPTRRRICAPKTARFWWDNSTKSYVALWEGNCPTFRL